MRESIARYKNFLTGEEIKEKKIKNGKLHGKYTVQLFKDGELTQEAESENIISTSCSDLASLQHMVRQVGSVYTDLDTGRNGYNFLKGNISGVLLTTANTPENNDNLFIEGDSLYYKSISSVNSIECSSTFLENGDLKITYVMDYLTTQANGTFQSIYLTQGHRYSTPSGQSSVLTTGEVIPYFGNYCFTTPFTPTMHSPSRITEFEVENQRFPSSGLDLENLSFTRGGCPLVGRWDIDAKTWRYYEFLTGEDHFWLTGSCRTVKSSYSHKTPFEDADGNFYHFYWTFPYTLEWNLVLLPEERKLSCRIEKLDKDGNKIKDIILDFDSLIPAQALSAISGIAPYMTHAGEVMFQLSFRGTRTTDTNHYDKYWQIKQRMFNLHTETFLEDWYVVGALDYNSTDRGLNECATGGYPSLREQRLRRFFRQIVEADPPFKMGSSKPKLIFSTTFRYYDETTERPSSRLKTLYYENLDIQGYFYKNYYASAGTYNRTKRLRGYSKKYNGWYVAGLTTSPDIEYYTPGLTIPLHQWYAHTCLPTPVTKTDVETMKIRYELTIPKNNFPVFEGKDLNTWLPNATALQSEVN